MPKRHFGIYQCIALCQYFFFPECSQYYTSFILTADMWCIILISESLHGTMEQNQSEHLES